MRVVRYKSFGVNKWAKSRLYERWCCAMVAQFVNMKRADNNFSHHGDQGWFDKCDPEIVDAWTALEMEMARAMKAVCDIAAGGDDQLRLKVADGDVSAGRRSMELIRGRCFRSGEFPSFDTSANREYLNDNIRPAVRATRARSRSVLSDLYGAHAVGLEGDDIGNYAEEQTPSQRTRAFIEGAREDELFDEDRVWQHEDESGSDDDDHEVQSAQKSSSAVTARRPRGRPRKKATGGAAKTSPQKSTGPGSTKAHKRQQRKG